MDHYFITGTGTGIGKSLVEELLGKAKITGYSRSNQIHHPDYTHHSIDLSHPGAVANMPLELPDDADRVVLINNAGTIGEINRTGDLSQEHYQQVFQLNLVSLTQICDRFLNQARTKNYPCLLLNISSGAAINPIPSWAAYCASKAGVDMFTRVLNAELQELKLDHIRVFSVYPGVVDTGMLAYIRSSDPGNFSSLLRFQEYKDEGKLYRPEQVTAAILSIFKDLSALTEPVVNLRDYIQ